MISALEHWSYCPRQCGLIHLESVWDENVFTLRGNAVHERADQPTVRRERGRRIERALPIWSNRYGLTGRADIVEFDEPGTPFPVEYKSGPAKKDRHAAIQLCAQALCLEEMFATEVPTGALYFAASQQRISISIDANLRSDTIAAIASVRAMLENFKLPLAKYDAKCRKCSLIDACLPQTLGRARAPTASNPFEPREEVELP